MATSYNPRIINAAQTVVNTHTTILGLEPHTPAEMQVFHTVLSILEYCDSSGLDFEFIIDRAREEAAVLCGEMV